MHDWLAQHEFFFTLFWTFAIMFGWMLIMALAGSMQPWPRRCERKIDPSVINVGGSHGWMENGKLYHYNRKGEKEEIKVMSFQELMDRFKNEDIGWDANGSPIPHYEAEVYDFNEDYSHMINHNED